MLKWVLGGLGVVLLGYYILVLDTLTFGGTEPDFTLYDARTYAQSIDGPLPVEIRVEEISVAEFPKAAVMAGASWTPHPIAVYAIQVVFEDGSTLIIDTAQDEALSKVLSEDAQFDGDAFLRMQAAMQKADKVILTHEHVDHIGGLTTHPQLQSILDHTDLTEEQVNHPERHGEAHFPEGALDGYVPVSYSGYRAVAPGVSLVKTPGHSPGSQLVLVEMKDGQEFLFVGDIAWDMESIETGVGRPRLVSWLFLHEDRATVFKQLKSLRQLKEDAPEVTLVVAHDQSEMDNLLAQGLITHGFK